MAKSGDKRRLEENKAHVSKIKNAILIINVIFIIARFIILRSTKLHYICTAITTILYYICFSAISNALAPYYAPTGELLYSGADLKDGSLEYYHDIIYLFIFTQLVALISDYAWLILLLIPGYAIVKITVSFIIPRMKASESVDIPESEVERKRREKKERQSARRQRIMGH